MDWGAPDLVAEDWEPTFRGILEDWAAEEPYTRLLLKTDDSVLRTPVPAGLILQTEWGATYDATIFGTHWPLVLGVQDSSQVTGRGAVPLVPLRYDKDLGYWWGLSADRMVSVDRLYFDGVVQGTGGWSVRTQVFGRTQATIVVIEEGFQPAKEVIVSADCHGPDENGLAVGDTLTGAPDQLRALFEEFALRRPPLAGWRGPFPLIEPTTWARTSEYFALHEFESARRFGADQTPETMAALAQSFLDTFLFTRMYWNPLGQIECLVIDPDDVDPDDALHLELDKHHDGGRVPYENGDAREVYTHVRMPYLYSPAEQKFQAAMEAHDVATVPGQQIRLPDVENQWSQGRFTRGVGVLNPAAPPDPEPPS
jgi:hypothetical protein